MATLPINFNGFIKSVSDTFTEISINVINTISNIVFEVLNYPQILNFKNVHETLLHNKMLLANAFY